MGDPTTRQCRWVGGGKWPEQDMSATGHAGDCKAQAPPAFVCRVGVCLIKVSAPTCKTTNMAIDTMTHVAWDPKLLPLGFPPETKTPAMNRQGKTAIHDVGEWRPELTYADELRMIAEALAALGWRAADM